MNGVGHQFENRCNVVGLFMRELDVPSGEVFGGVGMRFQRLLGPQAVEKWQVSEAGADRLAFEPTVLADLAGAAKVDDRCDPELLQLGHVVWRRPMHAIGAIKAPVSDDLAGRGA